MARSKDEDEPHTILAKRLQRRIRSREFRIGDRFPTEAELQQEYKLSRHAVRKSLKILTDSGLIGRRPRTGSIVISKQPISGYVHTIGSMSSLLEFAQATALEDRTIETVEDSAFLEEKFSRSFEGRWLRIAGVRRIRSRQAALCWSEVLIPERFVPRDPSALHRDPPFYKVILADHGLRLSHVEQEVRAQRVTRMDALALSCEEGSPALLVERRLVSSDGSTFGVSFSIYPYERYAMKLIIKSDE